MQKKDNDSWIGEHEEYPLARSSTADEVFLTDWGQEIKRETPKLLTDTLRQIVTLSTALLAGSVAFINSQVMDSEARTILTLGLIGSLTFGFAGLLPSKKTIALSDIEQLCQSRKSIIRHRLQFVYVSLFSFGCAIIAAVVGILLK